MPDIELAEYPYMDEALAGKDFILDINTGTTENPMWKALGGQRGTGVKKSADEIDASHKTSGGYKMTIAGLKSWSMEIDQIIVVEDEASEYVEAAFDQSKPINVRFRYPESKRAYIGWANVTELSPDAQFADVAALKMTLSGKGPLVRTSNCTVLPNSYEVMIGSEVDKVFNISPKTTQIVKVKNGSTELVKSTDYEYVNGILTIKSDYVKSLLSGLNTLSIETDKGSIRVAIYIVN